MENFNKLQKPPSVSIILLNWNGWEDTVECLESLYQIKYPNYNVIVIDNASTNESIMKLKEYCKGKIKIKSKFFKYDIENKPINIIELNESELINEIYLMDDLTPQKSLIFIKNDKNYGFAEGNNIGMEYAIKNLDPDYVLLLNNDTVVDKYFLNELVKIGESSAKIGCVGPKIYYYDFKGSKNVINFAGSKMSLYTTRGKCFGCNEVDLGQHDKIKETSRVEGCCMLIKTDVIKKVGMFDPIYFAYWEETDLCMRIKNDGFKLLYVPKAKIWHKVGTAKNGTRIFLMTRNMFFFMKKNASLKQYTTFLIYFFGFKFWFLLAYYLFYQKNYSNVKLFLKGVRNGLNPRD